jgi:valyl-tRNA synthetase
VEGRSTDAGPAYRSLADRWITTRLNHTIDVVTRDLTDYRFDEAANHLYRFVWHEFCDWYIELAKPRLSPEAPEHEGAATRATMLATLETTLRLLHPLMPFITEEIWQKLPHQGETIVLAPYPIPATVSVEDQAHEGIMEEIIALITAIRTMRSELNIPPAQKLRAGLITTADAADRIQRYGQHDIVRLARLSEFLVGNPVIPQGAVSNLLSFGEVFLVPEGIDIEKERARLAKSLGDIRTEMSRLDAKLKNPQFVAKAPPDVVTDHERRRSELFEQSLVLSGQLDRLGGGST